LTCGAQFMDMLTHPSQIYKSVNKESASSSPLVQLGRELADHPQAIPPGEFVRRGTLGEIAWVGMTGRLRARQVTDDGGAGEDLITGWSGGSLDHGGNNRRCASPCQMATGREGDGGKDSNVKCQIDRRRPPIATTIKREDGAQAGWQD
jgi:hypothetical protein